MPMSPTMITTIMLLHTMVRHMPIPSIRAPTKPMSVAPMVFPETFIGSLCYIFLHTITIKASTRIPAATMITPG